MNFRWQTFALVAVACAEVPASAASLQVSVLSNIGQPVADAVVYAETDSVRALPKPSHGATIEQRDRKFAPLVTVIQTGTAVSFPNNDTVQHHVYSFSRAKTFELKLYSGLPSGPVVFDKPGTVVVGCNIHDEMVAYIHVVDTPYFAKTNAAGQATIRTLPNGVYRLRAWHYDLPHNVPIPQQKLVVDGADGATSFRIPLKAGAVAH